MKSLRHICIEADRELSTGNTFQSLESLAAQWINEGKDEDGENQIGGYRIHQGKAHLLIVVEKIINKPFAVEYEVYRFFQVGGKWQVSCDLKSSKVKEMIQFLLNKQ